jgi:xanthine dehydrogenase accessory factor
MKELREILRLAGELPADETAVLATVVDVKGSSYRRPGARMLIRSSGDFAGTVSGGCLEADVLERAIKVSQTGVAQVFTYDTTRDDNSVFSLNMGCRGVIRILLEPISRQNELLDIFQQTIKNRISQVIVTVISAESENDIKIGQRWFYNFCNEFRMSTDNRLQFEINPDLLKKQGLKMLEDGSEYDTLFFGTRNGSFELSFELIMPPVSILLFGAGMDAVPVVEFAALLGWDTTVIDHRPFFLTKERFPKAGRLILSRTDDYWKDLTFDAQTAAVVMTHNYERDREILANLLGAEAFYLGMLGPKKRTENLLCELPARDIYFSRVGLERIHAPVGLDIGGNLPETVALSIIAEIQSVMKGRRGGFLRERKSSINSRAEAPSSLSKVGRI